MLNVKIKDFQSIGDVSFDIDKFTVIVGKNNLGKSAIIRAVDAALTNRTGSEFIRWGTLEAEVNIKKDNLEINWKKGDSATYRINNGKPLSKLNRATPKEILDAGIRKIEVGDRKINPLIAHQFEELFLINEGGSVITDVLSSIYDLDVLSDADDLCSKELKSNKSLLKTRTADLSLIKEQIDKYATLDEIKSSMEKIKILNLKVECLKNEISYLDYYNNQFLTLTKNIEILFNCLKTVIPSDEKIKSIFSETVWVSQATEAFKSLLVSVKKLRGASSVSIPEQNNLSNLITVLGELDKLNSEYLISKQLVCKLDSTINNLEDLKSIQSNLQFAEELSNSYKKLVELNEAFSLNVKSVRDLNAEIEKTDSNLYSIQKEYDKIEVCPLCLTPRNKIEK